MKALSNADIGIHDINRTRELFIDFKKYLHLYIACFSTEIEKLALWRYYASNGTGFAIGFNKNFYKLDNDHSVTLGRAIKCNVIYGQEKSIEIANRFIKCYSENKIHPPFEYLITKLISIIPSLKDESFKDEHEVRIVYPEGLMMQNFYFEDQYREFIPILGKNIPFVNSIQGYKPIITPDKFCDSDISEIWVGPSCEFIEARDFIRKLLKENGYNVKNIEIQESMLPFRNL